MPIDQLEMLLMGYWMQPIKTTEQIYLKKQLLTIRSNFGHILKDYGKTTLVYYHSLWMAKLAVVPRRRLQF